METNFSSGKDYSLYWGPRLNKKKKPNWVLALLLSPPWLWMQCDHMPQDSVIMTSIAWWTVSQNESFLKFILLDILPQQQEK